MIFSWLTGNADMHLKNFSLYRQTESYTLTPAYDLLSTAIVMPEDNEELALTLNGKKSRINRQDFETAMRDSGMDDKAIANIFAKFAKLLPEWNALIEISFLPKEKQRQYSDLIIERATRFRDS